MKSLFFLRNVNASDPKGRSALHLIASTGSVHARKMVSLLLQNGSHIGKDLTLTIAYIEALVKNNLL